MPKKDIVMPSMDYTWIISECFNNSYSLVLRPNDGHERSYLIKTGTKEEILEYLKTKDWNNS